MKISILDQFASDAINAPAAVTGGGGNCKPPSKHGSKSHKQTKPKTKSHSGSKNKCGYCPPPPCSPPPCH